MKNVWIWTDVLAPGLAAQLFAVVLAYLLIVRKRMTSGYLFYGAFLICSIVMLGGRVAQVFLKYPYGWYLNWFRVTLFMTVGIPSLLIVSARPAGVMLRRRTSCLPFVVGALISGSYVFLQDVRLVQLSVLPEAWVATVPFPVSLVHVTAVWLVAALGLLVFPNLFFIVREWRGCRNGTRLAFLSGAMLSGFFMALGAWIERLAVFYVGSMFCALIWLWAMFQHVRQMKGRVGVLKDELEWQMQSGQIKESAEVQRQLSELESLSQGDLALYKLRMRDILSSFTDAAIRAGGDSSKLIERAATQEMTIEQSDDPQRIRDVLSDEAVELSAMITEMQKKNESVTVQKAKQFMQQEYMRDLSIDEIAGHLNLSGSYVMREFKKQTGETLNRYLTGLRIAKAKELLVIQTVTETSFDVGYNHANYFSTVFKKETGMTPAEFKKTKQA